MQPETIADERGEYRLSSSLAGLSDEALVRLCQKELPEDFTSYQEVVRRFEGVVHETCYRMIDEPEEAREACQDVFVTLFRNIAQFEGRSSFKTWLFRVTYNLCLQRRGKLARKRALTPSLWAGVELEQLLPSLDNRRTAGLRLDLEAALARLSEADRLIIMERFVLGWSLEEIAEDEAIGLSAAKMRLSRATQRFREIFSWISK